MKRALLLFLVTLLGLTRPVGAEVSPEYKLKAAILFNFAKFVEWPPAAFADTNTPIVIGVLGENPFENVLDEIVRGRTINGRPLVIKKSRNLDELTDCHVLYISSSERSRQAQILTSLRDRNTLTVSDTDGFLGQGGIIQMRMEQQKVRFEVCTPAAERARVTISAQLLSLAAAVRTAPCGKDG